MVFKNTYLRALALPLLALAILLSIFWVWKFSGLPQREELIDVTKKYFNEYGLLTVFVSAVVEGLLVAGWYYPGSLIIFLGVVFAGKDLIIVTKVLLAVTAGFIFSHAINFFVGKYGWYRALLALGLREPLEKARERLVKHGTAGLFLSYWQPNFASLASTAAGILQFPFKKFLLCSLPAIAVWNIFWGGIVYFLGEVSLAFVGVRFALVFVAIWIVARLLNRDKEVSL